MNRFFDKLTGSRRDVWRRKSGKNRSYRSLSVGFRAKQGAAFFNRRLAAALRAARQGQAVWEVSMNLVEY